MRSSTSTALALSLSLAACGGGTPAAEAASAPPASSSATYSTHITETMGTMQPAAASSSAPSAPPASAPAPAAAPAPPPGPSSVASRGAAEVIGRLRSRFAACYRQQPELTGTPTLAVTHVNGEVTRLETGCPAVSSELEECLRAAVASTDLFPGTGRKVLGACADLERPRR